MEAQNNGFLNMLYVLAKHKKFIFWFVLIVCVATVIFTLVVPYKWTSETVILPVNTSETPLKMGESLLGMGASLLGSLSNYSGEDFVNILKSRTFTEDVIRHFNFIDYYEIQESDSLRAMDKAILKFAKKTRVVFFDEEYGTVIIKITTLDKNLSADVANYMCQRLDHYNRFVRLTKGKQNRMFLEKRVHEVSTGIDSLGLAMKAFMEKHHTVQLEDQTKEIIGLYAGVITDKMKNDIELEYARQYLKDETPMLLQLEQKNNILGRKVRDIEQGESPLNSKYILGLDKYSQIQYEYARLMLDLETARAVYEFIYPMYEKARLDELKDMPTIEVIDKARPAGMRAFPKRARICVTMFFVSFILAASAVFIGEYLNTRRADWERFRDTLLSK